MKTAQIYHWSDTPLDLPIPLLERRRIIGENVMLSKVVLKADCFVESHAHANEQFAIVLSGKVCFGIGAENSSGFKELTLITGEVLHLPPNVPHSARAIEETHILDIFSPPSQKTGIDHQAEAGA